MAAPRKDSKNPLEVANLGRLREKLRAERAAAKIAAGKPIKNGGPDRTKAWVDGVGPRPGELPPLGVPRPPRGPEDGARGPIADPENQGKDYRKRLDSFLYPPLPAAFAPYEVKKFPLSKLRERYLSVLSATMGNHSIALFYCCWTHAQFVAALTDNFKKDIAITMSQLADRATFLMHRGMGLVKTDDDVAGVPTGSAASALAKVVENLKAKDVEQESGGGFKLVVEGLDRSAPAPAVPDRTS